MRQDEGTWRMAAAGMKATHGIGRRILAAGTCFAIALVVVGCGGSDDPPPAPPATPTRTVPLPTATTTPLPSIAGEENLFGSTEAGSGALTIDSVPQIPTYFSACIGGNGPECTGGTNVFIGNDPGFKEADTSEETPDLFALPDGVTINVQVVSIDPVVSLRFEDGTLNAAGQSIEIGTTPHIHADLEWQLALPGGTPFGPAYPVTLKLTTTTSGFSESTQFTEVLRPSSGSPPPPD